jgi:hypothetical protein
MPVEVTSELHNILGIYVVHRKYAGHDKYDSNADARFIGK